VQCYSTHGQASGYISVYRDVFGQAGADGVGLTWPVDTVVEARLTAGQMRLLDNDRLALHTINPASGAVTIYGEYANHRAAHVVVAGDVSITLRVDGNDPAGGLWKRTVVLQQDATGGHNVTAWTNVVWPGGVAPTLSSAADAIDVFEFVRINGTSQWLGRVVGQNWAG
jgi:hypothetical protein